MRGSIAIAALLLLAACIDPVKFDTGSEAKRLVVDGFITNVSFTERQQYPAIPTRFYVALRWTSEVGNEKDEVIEGATVNLVSSEGESYSYYWDEDLQRYLIQDDDFAAKEGVEYWVKVTTPDGKSFESTPDRIYPAPPIEEVEVSHQTIFKSIQIGEQTQIVQQRGVQLSVPLAAHNDGVTNRYRWKIVPTFIFETSLLPVENPNQACYVTDLYAYQSIKVWEDKQGGYSHDILFIETDDNERIQYDYSAYITQYSLSPTGYRYWDDLAVQQQSGGGIFDPPPFTLTTNIQSTLDDGEKVSGFFVVAHESTYRWYLSPDDLPYSLTFGDPCLPIPGVPFIPPAGCGNCMGYIGGSTHITNQQPLWWRNY